MKRINTGYVKFTVIGAECEDFFTDAVNEGIKIYDVQNEKGVFSAKTSPKNYFRLAKLKRRYSIQMRIFEKHGLAFKAYKYRSRYGLLLGAVVYALTVFLCSTIVWDICVIGNKRISTESVLNFLAENGVYAGVARKNVSTTVNELKAMLSFDDLAWISIEAEGSRVNVKINERIDNPKNGLPASTPCNIIANHDGKIISAEIYGGTMLYEIGSGVKKDDVLVSGIVIDGAGNTSVNHADAKIIAEFEEEVSFYKEFVTVEQIKTDENYRNEYIKLFGFTFPRRSPEYLDGYTYTSDSYRVSLLGLTMPWSRLEVVGVKTNDVEVTRSANDVKTLLSGEMENYERNFLSDYEIIDREITYEQDEKGLKAVCRYTLKGNIALQSEIFYRE